MMDEAVAELSGKYRMVDYVNDVTWEKGVRNLEGAYSRQLHAARYAFHKIVQHKYREAMRRDAMTIEEATARYAKAMENYDGIVSHAVNGHSFDANDADMKAGFGG